MKLIERVHTRFYARRARRLAELMTLLVPQDSKVLDVGCGDGLISMLLVRRRPDISIQGVEVLIRDSCQIPVARYDGRRLPYDAGSFDAVMFVGVLHHTEDPTVLLDEAVRVSRRTILIKDHLREGAFSQSTLRLMDDVGNARFGGALPHNYWRRKRWLDAFNKTDLVVSTWLEHLGLYPWPASLVFDRRLHFIARLEKKVAATTAPTFLVE